MSSAVKFLRSEIAKSEAVKEAEVQRLQAEDERRSRPFPQASDPEDLVAAGVLVDVSAVASRMRETSLTVEGFNCRVLVTDGAAAVMRSVGIRTALCCAYGAHQHSSWNVDPRHRFLRTEFFAGEGGDYLVYQPCPMASGVVFVVLHARGEACPAWVPAER
jgi:hypothetical protein